MRVQWGLLFVGLWMLFCWLCAGFWLWVICSSLYDQKGLIRAIGAYLYLGACWPFMGLIPAGLIRGALRKESDEWVPPPSFRRGE